MAKNGQKQTAQKVRRGAKKCKKRSKTSKSRWKSAESHWETKGRFRKRVVLANVPSFRFSFRGNMRTYPRSGLRSNVPSFRFSFRGSIRQNHPFGKPPFSQPQKKDWGAFCWSFLGHFQWPYSGGHLGFACHWVLGAISLLSIASLHVSTFRSITGWKAKPQTFPEVDLAGSALILSALFLAILDRCDLNSKAARRGTSTGGFPILTRPSRFALFRCFRDFPDFSVFLFSDLSLPLSWPFKSTYKDHSRKGP